MEINQSNLSTSDSAVSFQKFRDRLHALKMLQRDYVRTEIDFHRKFFGLDMEYQEKRQQIYEHRKNIVNGMGDISDEIPNDVVTRVEKALNRLDLSKEYIDNIEQTKGIPKFWLQAMKNCTHSNDFIQDCDDDALQYLRDINIHLSNEPELSFTLNFEFDTNPFFENTVLTKQYFLDCDTDDEFCGFSIIKAIGCEIYWKDGMNIIETEPESFFKFFNPPDLLVKSPDHGAYSIESSTLYELQQDFEIGLFIKERLIPNAVLYYLDEVDETNEYYGTFGDSDETVISDTCL